jgi:multimeric flavodoxin WrbA
MKVLAIIGTPTRDKGYTTRSVEALEASMRQKCELQIEYVFLEDINLSRCQGYLTCVKFGEQQCPVNDELQPLLEKMRTADAIVLASPVHCFNVSTLMKNFIDLLVYQMHRPEFFGKKALVVTSAAGAGQKGVLKYLRKTAAIWGLDVVGQFGTHSGLFEDERYIPKLTRAADSVATQLVTAVERGQMPKPGLAELINFRVWRSVVKRTESASPFDWEHWQNSGWLEQDYYYPVTVNPVSNGIAWLLEKVIDRAIRNASVKPVS